MGKDLRTGKDTASPVRLVIPERCRLYEPASDYEAVHPEYPAQKQGRLRNQKRSIVHQDYNKRHALCLSSQAEKIKCFEYICRRKSVKDLKIIFLSVRGSPS